MTHQTAASAKIGSYSKAIVALIGSVLTLLTQLTPILGFLPAGAQGTVSTVLAIGTGVVTYLVKNTPSVQQVIDDGAALGLEVKNRV